MSDLVVTIAPYALPYDIARSLGIAAGNKSALDVLRILRVEGVEATPDREETEIVHIVIRGDADGVLAGGVEAADLLRDTVTLSPGWKSLVAPRTPFWAAAARVIADTFGGSVYLNGDDTGTPAYTVPSKDNRSGSWTSARDAEVREGVQARLAAIVPLTGADLAAAAAELAVGPS